MSGSQPIDGAPPADTEPRLSLALPDAWKPIPLEPGECERWVAASLADHDLTDEQARAVQVAFRSTMVEATAEGLVLASGFVELSDDGSGGVDALVGAAFAAVRPAGELAGKLTSFAWMAALADADRTGDLELLDQPEVVVLGELQAVRAVTLEELPADATGPAIALFGINYYVTIADGTAMLVLGFRTPCVWLAPEFEALFADIAASLEVDV